MVQCRSTWKSTNPPLWRTCKVLRPWVFFHETTVTPNPIGKTTYSGSNVKVEDGWSGSIYVVFQELQYDIWGNLWAMDGNGHMQGACGLILFQLLSHSCNEEGLPHTRPSGADYPYTGTVCACMCVEKCWSQVCEYSMMKTLTFHNLLRRLPPAV